MRFRTALVVASALLLAAACDSAGDPGADGSFLSEGDPAPGFTLPSASGERVALADFTNRKPVLLYFSMGPGWGGCVLQVVDLQKSEAFQSLGVELVSIAPDTVEAWRDDGEQYGIEDYSAVLSDVQQEVARSYDVLRWAAGTGEPGHTFILIDESGTVTWVKDYGALEHGGIMYVVPDEIVRELKAQL